MSAGNVDIAVAAALAPQLRAADDMPVADRRELQQGNSLEAQSDLRVLMLGPGMDVRGGVTSVERLILEAVPASIQVRHVPTVVEGSKLAKTLAFLRALRHFNEQLRHRPDIVHIHFASRASSVRKEWLARRALARGLKVIMHSHGAEYRLYWNEMSPRARARSLEVLSRVDALIVLGEAWREFFVSIGVPAERVVVMPNPVRLPPVVPQRVENGIVNCVYLGILSNRKGAFDLVKAVSLLPPECRARMRLTMAGNGKGSQLRALVRELGIADCLSILDWVDPAERDALLGSAHVFLLPSYHEGLPMALLEAMAFGTVPITTAVGSIGEVVQHGTNGLLVPPGDLQAIAAALQRLIERPNERRELAVRARRSVEPLGLDAYIESLAQLYRDVMRRAHRSAKAA